MVDVILVDKDDNEIGVEEKISAHKKALLHRAFSVFVFDEFSGELLIQQRASTKYHCPNIWANTCCSHPFVGEENINASHRRLVEEMGFDCELNYVGNFIYKAEFDNGLTEHEFDHVFVGIVNKNTLKFKVNPEEVRDYKWILIKDLVNDIKTNPEKYSPWLEIILNKYSEFLKIK